jgi:predicted PurR-regulated permease PerM
MEPTPTQRIARIILAVLLVLLGAWTLRNYLAALVWAGVLAIAVWPLFERARRRWPPGRHNIRLPLLFTLAIGLLFLVPLVLIALRAATELHQVFDWLQQARNQGLPVPDWVQHLPVGAGPASQWWQDHLSSPDAARQTLKQAGRAQLLDYSRHFGEQLVHRAILFGFTLLTLFFLFRDGRTLVEQLRTASHKVLGPHGERIGQQIIASIHGTVDGLVLVGLGEGLLLGIAYVIVGVPQAVLLGAVTALAATIPFGAVAAYLLAAVVLLAAGSSGAAIFIAVLGSVVVFVADHFVRPALIGGSTHLPFLFVLLGILGGLETLGLLGLFLGPALMAVLVLLWREWTSRSPQSGL